jgi:quinol monooxygenase YgiN
MNVRIVTVQFKPGKLDEAIKWYGESVVPDVRAFPGVKALFMLTNPETNKGLSVAMYESEAEMKAQEASGWLQKKMAALVPLMAAPPTTEYFETSIEL